MNAPAVGDYLISNGDVKVWGGDDWVLLEGPLLTITFEQFDEACRVDWEWTNISKFHTRETWLTPSMAGVREKVYERMRHTLLLLGVDIAEGG